jgi:hypothetical protein
MTIMGFRPQSVAPGSIDEGSIDEDRPDPRPFPVVTMLLVALACVNIASVILTIME